MLKMKTVFKCKNSLECKACCTCSFSVTKDRMLIQALGKECRTEQSALNI